MSTLHRFRRFMLSSSTSGSGSTAIDLRVTDWVNRVVQNGGATPSLATQLALTTFLQTLDSTGLTQKMIVVNPFVPDSFIAALTPLIRGSGYSLWKTSSMVSGDLSSDGFTGNGLSKYIDSGIQSFAAFDNQSTDIGITLYLMTNNSATAVSHDTLANDGTGSTQVALIPTFQGQMLWDVYSTTTNLGRVIFNYPYYKGYVSGNYGTLDGSNKQAVYVANPFVAHTIAGSSTGATGGTAPKSPLYILAGDQNYAPVSGSYSPRTVSFYAAHRGLKSADSVNFYNAVQSLRIALGGGYIPSDPVAYWVKRVVANGGATPSSSTQTALSTFYNGLVTDGILAKMKIINAFVPDSLTAALTPFWNLTGAGGLDPWVNHSFVSGDLTVNGLKGDGSSKYLEVGFYPNLVYPSALDAGVTIYVSGSNTNLNEQDVGVGISGSQTLSCYVGFGGTCYFDAYNQTAGQGRISATNTSYLGYISFNVGSLGGSTTRAVYEANSGLAHTTLVSGTSGANGSLPNQPIIAFGSYGLYPSVAQLSSKRISFIAIHDGLTSAESALFYARVQTLRTALGGGFV